MKYQETSKQYVEKVYIQYLYTLKKGSFLKIKNNSSSVNLAHLWEKTHLLALEFIFVSSSGQVYMHIEFHILNEKLEWYKNLSIIDE